MGGKALKQYGVNTVRYNTKEFLELASRLIPKVKQLFKTEVHLVNYYFDKASHGDMDLIVLNNGNLGNIHDMINSAFSPNAIYCNNSVYSFDYENFQVDIILQTEDNWEVAKCFFDMDPTGNLFGKFAKKFGLKYGFDGLKYIYRSKFTDNKLGEIVISKDNARIFEFLGFDYGRYLQGFATKQDIFDYITSNEYFDPTNFQFDNLNSIDRQRNRKRQTYLEFLEYVNSNVFEVKRKYKEKSECIAIIDQFFPESKLIKSIAKFDATEERSHVVRSKFNGNLVMEWTGVVGQELGKVINDFKFDMLITENDFDEFIFDAEADEIKTIFLSWYNNRL